MSGISAVKTMPNKKNYSAEPFGKCLSCPDRGVICRGKSTSDMPLETWRSFMRAVKDYEGYTYAEISERTNPPIAPRTVEKKLAPGGDGQDLMRDTARAIENAILGCAPFPCYLDLLESVSNINNLQVEIARLTNELSSLRIESQKKIDHLLSENERKNRIIDKLLDK